jgi:outer membrane protein assembly factor BamA
MRAEFGGTITLSKRRGYYGTHRAWLGYSNMRIADTVAQLNANFFGAGQMQFAGAELGYGYVHDFRDNNAYPLKGHFFSAETRWRGIGNERNNIAIRGNYAKFLPLSKRFFFSTDWMGSYAFAPNIALPYAFSAGLGYGKNFVRGYDLFVIDGEATGMIRNDFRFKALDKKLDLKFIPIKQFSQWPITVFPKAFLDAGYVHNRQMHTEMNVLSNRLLLGGGIGLDVITSYNSAFRFECSVNQQGQRGFYFYWKAGF